MIGGAAQGGRAYLTCSSWGCCVEGGRCDKPTLHLTKQASKQASKETQFPCRRRSSNRPAPLEICCLSLTHAIA